MIIRESKKGDVPQMYNLLQQEWPFKMDLTKEEYNDYLLCLENGSKFYVADIDGSIVGMLMLQLQNKLLRDGSIVGFIEEVVVDEKERGKKIGERLIKEVVEKAKQEGCYKVILSCKTERVGFYERCGFRNDAHTMRIDL
tara:strand:+ start:266 stop:685 length:420 start_codon:yes stop_codon:yes gene_type:complete